MNIRQVHGFRMTTCYVPRTVVEAMACHRSCASAAQSVQQPTLGSAWAHCDGRPFVSTRRERGRRRRSVVHSSATLAEPRTLQTSSPDLDQQPLSQRLRSRETRFAHETAVPLLPSAGCFGRLRVLRAVYSSFGAPADRMQEGGSAR